MPAVVYGRPVWGYSTAHERGLVHRDLKPQNLMLTQDSGIIKILDFGLAKVVSENKGAQGLTKTNMTMGTYEYSAPEQAIDAASADIRADIYSLGCTLYYLLAGVLPFDYNSDAKLLLRIRTRCRIRSSRSALRHRKSCLTSSLGCWLKAPQTGRRRRAKWPSASAVCQGRDCLPSSSGRGARGHSLPSPVLGRGAGGEG